MLLIVVALFSYLFFYYGNSTYFGWIGGQSFGDARNASMAFSVISGDGTFLYGAVNCNVPLKVYLMTPDQLIDYINASGGNLFYILDTAGTNNSLSVNSHGTPPGYLLGSITTIHHTFKYTIKPHSIHYVYVLPIVPTENVTVDLRSNSYLSVYDPPSLLFKYASSSHPIAVSTLKLAFTSMGIAMVSLIGADYYFLRLKRRKAQ